MDNDKWTPSEAEQTEFAEHLGNSLERHNVRFDAGLVPGYNSFVLDVDVRLPLWGKAAHAGLYLMRLPEAGTNTSEWDDEYTWLWTFERVDAEAAPREVTEQYDQIVRTTCLYVGEDSPLTLLELTTWLAIQDAENDGDAARADRIFYLTYGLNREDVFSEPQKDPRKLPRQDVRRLRRQNDPISKVANVMTNPALFGEAGALLDVAGKGERKRGRDVSTAVSFSWDGEGVEIYRPISQYDREVHGAVSSLWADGQRNVTPHQIAKAMGIKNPTKQQAKRVAESVDLQRRVLGKIDFTEEARGRTLTFEGEPVASFKLEGYLIAADKAELGTANGRIVEGYVMHRAPLVYQHAATLGHVVSYPQRLLELGEGRDTEQNLILRRELQRRIHRIKNRYETARAGKRQEVNRSIRFTTDEKHPGRSLFERADVKQADRDARKRAIDFVLGILDGMAECGEIADYKPMTERGRGGTRTVGAEIIL